MMPKKPLEMSPPKANKAGSSQEQEHAAHKHSSSGCCMGTTTCSTTATPTSTSFKPNVSISSPRDVKKGPKTRIIVKYDVGFNNMLYIRGKGANLNWDKGIPLKNTKSDEWVWETEVPFSTCEFKILINDHHYEHGENHPLTCGASIQYTPKF